MVSGVNNVSDNFDDLNPLVGWAGNSGLSILVVAVKLLLIVAVLTTLPCAGQDFSASSPSTNENHVIAYTVSSVWNAPSTTPLRVLVPTNPSNVVARFILVLPVEPEPQDTYGEGIEVLRTSLAHELYNAVVVEPQFQSYCWYGDNDFDANKQYESFVVQGVVPWMRTNFSRTGNEKIYLLGFSKSGFGAINLLTRNPTVFEGAAAWDFPAAMTDSSEFGASDTFGSQENFTSNYQLSIENMSAREAAFQCSNRIWISGNHSPQSDPLGFSTQTLAFDTMLTSLGILHTMDDPAGSVIREHRWDSGWTSNALQWIGSVTPAVTIVAVPGTTICAGVPVTFTATPVNGGTPTYQWRINGSPVAGETSSAFTTATLQNADVVTVIMTSNYPYRSGDTATSNPMLMTVNPLPTVSVNSTTICAGDPTTLTASTSAANPSYLWSPGGETTGAILVCASTTTIYTVMVTDGTTGCAGTGTGTVTVNPLPSVSVNSATVCAGNSAILTTTTSASNPTFLWSPGGATTPSITVSPGSNTTYTVTVTDGATGCFGSGSGIVTVNPNLTPSVSIAANPPGPICSGMEVVFTATPVNGGASPTYQWQTNGVAVVGATGVGFTTAALANGTTVSCVMTPSTEICVSPATATSALLTMTINSFGLSAIVLSEGFGTNGTSLPAGWSATPAPITWTVSSTAASSGYAGASGGNNVSLTLGGDSTTYLVSPTLDCSGVTAGGILNFGLRKSSASFTNHLVVDVSLDNGATWDAFTATILNAEMTTENWGLQTVELGSVINHQSQVVLRWHFAASGNGSTSTSNVSLDDIRLNTTPVTMAAIVASGPTTFCMGETVTLSASASGSAYLWSTAETTPSITVSTSGTYTVTILDANGCSGTASQVVTVNPLPTVSVNSTTICAGDPTTLTASTSAANPSYLWSPGGETTGAIQVSPSTTTIYTVMVTDGTTGCAGTGTGTVTVNPLPSVSVNSATVCAGDSAILTATTSASNPTFLWSPGGATTPSITVSRGSNTTYTVTVTDGATGCFGSGSGIVTVNSATADNVTLTEIKGQVFHLEESVLLAHASGTGGATLSSVQSPSANGVSITRSGGQIFYGANLTGNDSFSYTVTSATGSCSATSRVSVVGVTVPQPVLRGPTNGVLTILFFGVPEATYVIQTTSDLSSPWFPVGTNTAGLDGSLSFTDLNATNIQQFYRAVQP